MCDIGKGFPRWPWNPRAGSHISSAKTVTITAGQSVHDASRRIFYVGWEDMSAREVFPFVSSPFNAMQGDTGGGVWCGPVAGRGASSAAENRREPSPSLDGLELEPEVGARSNPPRGVSRLSASPRARNLARADDGGCLLHRAGGRWSRGPLRRGRQIVGADRPLLLHTRSAFWPGFGGIQGTS